MSKRTGEKVVTRTEQEALRAIIAELSPEEARIARMRFGMGEPNEASLRRKAMPTAKVAAHVASMEAQITGKVAKIAPSPASPKTAEIASKLKNKLK